MTALPATQHFIPLHSIVDDAKDETDTQQDTQAQVPGKVEAAAAAETEMQFEIDASSVREERCFQ